MKCKAQYRIVLPFIKLKSTTVALKTACCCGDETCDGSCHGEEGHSHDGEGHDHGAEGHSHE